MGAIDILNAVEPFGWAQHGWSALVGLAGFFFLVLTVLFGFALVWRVRRVVVRAGQLDALVKKLAGDNPRGVKSAKGWEESVAGTLGEIGFLAAPAQEFREQCWVLDEQLYNDQQADMYFSMDVVDPGHADFGGTVPGLLTALGILGTFVGITVGLGEIGVGSFGTSDQPAMAQAARLSEDIGRLVQSLGVSFRTSIWGLVFSMLSTAFMTAAQGRLFKSLAGLLAWLDGAVERGTEQSLLVRLERTSKEQLAELQGLADEITQGFENAINGHEGQGGLAGVLRTMSDRVAKSQAEGVEGLVNNFIEQMNDKLGSQFASLGGSIDTMVGANAGYQEAMGGLVQQLDQASQAQSEVAKTVAEAVGKSNEAVGTIGATVDALAASAQSVRSASEGMGTVLDRQSAVMDRQESLSGELVEALRAQESGWRSHHEAISESYAGIQERFDGLAGAVSALIAWHEAVKNELNEQVSSWGDAVKTQRGLTELFAAERTKTAELLKGLGDATTSFRDLGGGLQRLAEQLQSQVGDVRTTQTQSAAQVEAAAVHLDKVGRTLGETWDRYRSVAAELNSALPNITSLLEGIQQSVSTQESVVSAGRDVAEQMKKSAEAQRELREGFEAIARAGEATKAALQPVASAITEGAGVLDEAAAALKESSLGNAELATGVRSAVDALAEQQQHAAETWSRVSAAVERTSAELDKGMADYSERVNTSLKGALGDFDKQLGSAVTALGEAIYSLQELVESIDWSKAPE